MSDDGNMRAIAVVRKIVAAYWTDEKDKAQARFAVVGPLDEVVARVLADLVMFEKMYLAEVGGKDALRVQIARLNDELADMRRPMTAQMEMQNRTITALNCELQREREARLEHAQRHVEIVREVPK